MSFGNTLIIGVGPAAINLAVNISKKHAENVGIATRESLNSKRIAIELSENGFTLISNVSESKISHLAGKVVLSFFSYRFEDIHDNWDTMILCTPSDTYRQVITSIDMKKLMKLKLIILLSPTFGSNFLVTSQLMSYRREIEVISLSTYYGVTKLENFKKSLICSLTSKIKKKVYVGSSYKKSRYIYDVKDFLEDMGINCEIEKTPVEAESKSVNLYVHPAFCINEFSLYEIFYGHEVPKYVYKIYPEGPITQYTIRTMVNLWKEISGFIKLLGGKPVNLLKFLNDDNYPVQQHTLSRDDIENFSTFNQTTQEYLLYIRYSSIIIDPFSQPDSNGRYYDFSAIPFNRVYKDEKGLWNVPRIPLEDYKKLKLIYFWAQASDYSTPEIKKLIDLFEKYLKIFIEEKGEYTIAQNIIIDNVKEEVYDIINKRNIKNK